MSVTAVVEIFLRVEVQTQSCDGIQKVYTVGSHTVKERKQEEQRR